MGSLTSMLMHTLFNVNVTINNVIVKLAAGGTMATLTCKSIMACTPDDGWQEELEVLPALLFCLDVGTISSNQSCCLQTGPTAVYASCKCCM